MVDSIFKGPDQIQSGLDIQKEIQKRTETKPLDIVVKLAGALAKGKGSEIKRNMARITSNLEDEKASLKSFSTQATENQERIKTLRDNGNGDLVQGIMNNFLDIAGVKDVASMAGIEARYSKDLFAKMKEEAQKQANILLTKDKEYKTLRSSYNPDNPTAGILSENLEEAALFTKPVSEALYRIGLNQRDLGNNRLWDVITRKEQKNKYNLINDGISEETKLNDIISATRASRANLANYVPDPEFLQSLIQEDLGEGKGSDRLQKQIKDNVKDVITKTRQWLSENNREYLKGDYFFQQASPEAAIERANQNYDTDYQEFVEFSGYTDEQLQEIYWQGTTLVSTFEEKGVQNLLINSDPGGAYGAEEESNTYKASLAAVYRKYNRNIDIMPEEIKRKIITGLSIPGYEEQQITKEEYFQKTSVVQNRVLNLPEEYQDLYNKLGGTAEIDFRLSVISDAKYYMAQYKFSENKAYDFALQNQKFGLSTGSPYELPLGFQIARDNRFQSQPLLPIKDSKLHQDILQNYPIGQNLSEGTFSQYLNKINKNKVYWYHENTLSNNQPVMWEDGQQMTIGQYTVEFSRTPDEDNNHFINITP